MINYCILFFYILLLFSIFFILIRLYIFINIIISILFTILFYLYHFLYKKWLLEQVYLFFSKLKIIFKNDWIHFFINLLYHLILTFLSFYFFIIFLSSYLFLCLLILITYLINFNFTKFRLLFIPFFLLSTFIYLIGWYSFLFFFNWFLVLKFFSFLINKYIKTKNKVPFNLLKLKPLFWYLDFFIKTFSLFVSLELFLNYYLKCLCLYKEFKNNNIFDFKNCFLFFNKVSTNKLLLRLNILFSLILFFIIYINLNIINIDFISIWLSYQFTLNDIPFSYSHRIIIYLYLKSLLKKNIFNFIIYFKTKFTIKFIWVFILVLIFISFLL